MSLINHVREGKSSLVEKMWRPGIIKWLKKPKKSSTQMLRAFDGSKRVILDKLSLQAELST